MGAARLPKILVLTIDDFVSPQERQAKLVVQARPSLSFLCTRIAACYPLLELRLALLSYQDYHMLLLTLAGDASLVEFKGKRSIPL